MPSSDGKGIRNKKDRRREPPDRTYWSLTEAATWIVEGDCRDDDYLIRQEGLVAWLNRPRWHSMSGPAWLLPHLKLLLEGMTPKNLKNEKFAAAKQWLDKTGRNPKDAYDEVQAIVTHLDAVESAYARLYALLWDECSLGHIVLSGIKCREGKPVSGEREDIPPKFFVDPIVHWRGGGPHHKGELAPDVLESRRIKGNDVLAEREAILNGKDQRPSYIEVRVKREDAMERKHLLDNALTSPPGTQREKTLAAPQPVRGHPIRSDLRFWYQREWVNGSYREWLKREGRPPGATPSAADDLIAARERFGKSVSRDMIRDVRRKFAPQDWKLAGKRKL